MMLATSPRPRPRPIGKKRPLAFVLREHGALDTSLAVDVIFEICDGLARAHAEGVVHGDLGAHCVRLAWPPDPAVGVGEVEIFSIGDDNDRISMITASSGGWSMKKTATLAPEQRTVGARVDARADIWAVGALLRTMLGGTPPRTLLPLVDACLDPDPTRRPQTIEEVGEKIASYASSPPDCYARIAQWRTATRRRQEVVRSETTAAARALERLDRFALDRALGPREELVDPADIENVEEASAYDELGFEKSRLKAEDLSPLITPPPFQSPLATPVDVPSGLLSDGTRQDTLRLPPQPPAQPRAFVLFVMGIVAAISCIVFGISMGFYAVRRVTAPPKAADETVEAAPARTAKTAPPAPVKPVKKEEAKATDDAVTPASLPDSPLPTFTPSSLPEARARR